MSQVRISEMLLGPPPANFIFAPKHKAQAAVQTELGMALGPDDGQDNG